MSHGFFIAFTLFEAAILGTFFLLFPRITRRGLLFGVYVGEAAWDGADATRIRRAWYRAAVVWIVVCLAGSLLLWAFFPHPAFISVPSILLFAGFAILYLRAYGQARRLAAVGPPPPAAAALAVEEEPPSLLPVATLAFGAACGLFAVAYCWSYYDDLPATVPTHFGPSGAPDDWRPKSFFSVMLAPILTLIMGIGLGGVAWLTAHAKRTLRVPNVHASLAAQLRFRRAVTRLLSGVGLLVSAMLTVLSVSAIRVGLGLSASLPPILWVLGGALFVCALGGSIYIAVRYGQGGSRIEGTVGEDRLTDGLADNRRWVLGLFYINREDPSFLVEDRFGLGYTLNLGNWKAIIVVGGFVVVLLALAALAVVTL